MEGYLFPERVTYTLVLYNYVQCINLQHIDTIMHVNVYITTCHFSSQDGYSPLGVSAQVGDLSTAELLLREGANVDLGHKVSLYISNDLYSYMYTCTCMYVPTT